MSEIKQTKASAALAQFVEAMDLGSPQMDDDYSLRLAEMLALLEPKETVKVKRLRPDAVIPVKAHANDAGFDLVAVEDTIIQPGETALIKTGLAFELPPGFEAQIRPRSGVTLKTKLRVQLGTVDSNYRGEVGVIVDNIAEDACGNYMQYLTHIDGNDYRQDENGLYPTETYIIRKGDRIGQLVVQRLPNVVAYEVETLGESERGAQGFGSTGVNTEVGDNS